MRTIFVLLVASLTSLSISAQIKGNGQVVTRQIPVSSLERLEISLYANIEVDMSTSNSLTITAEENLLDYIDYEVLDGRLELNQKEWIKATKKIVIQIGAPDLKWIQQGTHDRVYVRNIDREEFSASALVGDIILEGSVDRLYAGGEVGDIDARNLLAENVEVNFWNRGRIRLSAPKTISGILKESGQVIYESEETELKVKTKGDAKLINLLNRKEGVTNNSQFINFKLKNNSLKRINAYVRGPKADGSYFSYGFPMLPGQVRKKDWAVGSKVYKVSPLGIKKLLVEITEEDEDQVVMLYPKK